jgi:RecA/RadA recombinase
MLIESTASQLVLIDIQAKLLPAMFEGADVLANALRLAQAARLMRCAHYRDRAVSARFRTHCARTGRLCA